MQLWHTPTGWTSRDWLILLRRRINGLLTSPCLPFPTPTRSLTGRHPSSKCRKSPLQAPTSCVPPQTWPPTVQDQAMSLQLFPSIRVMSIRLAESTSSTHTRGKVSFNLSWNLPKTNQRSSSSTGPMSSNTSVLCSKNQHLDNIYLRVGQGTHGILIASDNASIARASKSAVP